MRDELTAALPRAYVAAYRWLGDRDESRDACQEAATRAWGSRATYDAARPFYPWFYRILRNICVDRLRIRPRETALMVDVVQPGVGAEQALLVSERERLIHRAIAGLPDASRELIELRHFQELSYEEIATILGCPVGTVMSRLYRARKALSAAVRAFEAVSGPVRSLR